MGSAFMGDVVEGGVVHAFVHVSFLDVQVPIHVDDPQIALDMGRNSSDKGEAQAVVPPQSTGKTPDPNT